MATVRVEPSETFLAERRKLGLDLFDEMWEGELHMVPAPSFNHQDIGTQLIAALVPIVATVGLKALYETGLYDPDVAGHESFRVPDVTVFEPRLVAARGIEGPASLVVEIRSPNDETFDKFPYYERLAVGEVLVIDPTRHEVRHWTNGPDGLVEDATGDGPVELGCVPVRLGYQATTLVVEKVEATGPVTPLFTL